VLFGLLVAVAGAFTALQTLAHARENSGGRRISWLLVAGVSAAAGIWATHFLAIRAFNFGVATGYDAPLTIATLLVAAALTTVGLALAMPGGRMHAVAGGSVIGVGIVITHVVGMQALVIAGTLQKNPFIAVPVNVVVVALACAAMLAYHDLGRRLAPWVAAGLLSLATCGHHLAAVGSLTLVADATAIIPASAMPGPALAILVACTTALIMCAARGAALVYAQAEREAQLGLRHRHEELEQREAELCQQIQRFDMALTNMPHGLCMVDARQHLVVCNQRYAEMYRLPPELTRPGTHVSDLLEHRIASGVFSASEAEKFRDERSGPIERTTTHTYRLGDGRTVSISRQPMADGGWIAVHEDITERVRLEEAERQSKQTLAAVVDTATVAIVCVARDLTVQVWSREAERIFGYTAEETIGQPYKLVPPDRRAEFDALFARALAGETLRGVHVQRRRKDGTLVDVSFGSAPMYDAYGNVRAVAYALEDVTERQQLGARLDEQNRLLKQHEETLRAQNLQLDAALNNMVQGLVMFDAGHRVVIANARYAEMYGLTSEQVQPGTSLRQIIEHRIAAGLLEGRSADNVVTTMLSRVSRKGESHYTTRMSDGRYYVVSSKPMPDGGTVTTHQDITEQRRSEAKIAHMALHDALTGLPNRALLNERLEQALTRIKRGELVAAHLLDLDLFKNVNDTLGHPVGDKLLEAVAARLRGLVRETDTVARMGGDEFAIVQVAIAQPADATTLAQRIIEVVSEPYELDGHQVIIATSVGIAIGPADGEAPDQLMRNADLALYRAKGDGRGTYCFFEPDMDAQMQARSSMEHDLRKALGAGEFELYYQPVVTLECNEVSGFEALIRWHHPVKGMISPMSFIPLAEETGLIVPLGEWAIRQACATAARWPEHTKIAVNLSPAQFRNPGLVQVVVHALASSGLSARRLELEITETILLEATEATLAMLYQLRGLGVRIAMDDFGTGYSSLSYLQSFPFDRIKIDRSFIKNIGEGAGALNIVRAVAAMANGLGMATTAEGVETKEQLESVRSEGCTEIQGYYFSRPRPASEIEALYLSYREATPAPKAASAA
jgi:diguanylate cyclase (GGDEF)-like protein/PAS domain S-box-containing protein